MKRSEIVEEARRWINTPFLHQGRNKMGIDCAGLVQKVGDKFAIPYDDLQGYARAPTDPSFRQHLRKFLIKMPILSEREGLIGVFRQSVYPCHIGIFAKNSEGALTLINAHARRRKVVEDVFDPKDMPLVELLSFPGMED